MDPVTKFLGCQISQFIFKVYIVIWWYSTFPFQQPFERISGWTKYPPRATPPKTLHQRHRFHWAFFFSETTRVSCEKFRAVSVVPKTTGETCFWMFSVSCSLEYFRVLKKDADFCMYLFKAYVDQREKIGQKRGKCESQIHPTPTQIEIVSIMIFLLGQTCSLLFKDGCSKLVGSFFKLLPELSLWAHTGQRATVGRHAHLHKS